MGSLEVCAEWNTATDPMLTQPYSVRSETLLIDLADFRELSFDPDTNIATASTSITGGELNPMLARYGRFFAGGHCPTVGIGGFLLQGYVDSTCLCRSISC